jgi:hypothetical protein
MINSDNLHDVLNTGLVTPIPESTVSKIISLPPFISVSGVSNFRDLSYENNLRPGYVYRSANLSDITEEGKVMFTADLGITTIFDLRNEGERAKAPPPHIEGIDTIWMPYGARPASLNLRDFAGEDKGANGFVKMYTGILEACVPVFTKVFKHIRDQPDDPFVFHCSGMFNSSFLNGHLSSARSLSLARSIQQSLINRSYSYSWQRPHRRPGSTYLASHGPIPGRNHQRLHPHTGRIRKCAGKSGPGFGS